MYEYSIQSSEMGGDTGEVCTDMNWYPCMLRCSRPRQKVHWSYPLWSRFSEFRTMLFKCSDCLDDSDLAISGP